MTRERLVTLIRARRPWYLGAIVALAVLLRAPILGAGFVSDDYVLLAGLEGRSPLANTPWALWTFYDGVPVRQAKLVFGGALPWWTEPTASHAFFRPLSSGVLACAHAIFGLHAAGYYALLLALCAYTLLVAARLFDRLLSRSAATVALLFFAFHTLHVDPTRWISTIHILLSTAAGLTGLWWHLRWRVDGWRPGRFASVAAFVVGLLFGETGLCLLAFVVLRELLSSDAPRTDRARAIAAPILLAVGYVALYRALHLGAHGIDGYLDPGENLPRFVSSYAERLGQQLPRLVTAPAEGLVSEMGPGADTVAALVLGAGVAVLVGLAFAFDRAAFRACGFWTAGAIASALPALMGPTDRALYPATLGSSAALGLVAASAWAIMVGRVAAGSLVRVLAALAGALVVFVHVGVGAMANFEGARSMADISSRQRAAVSALELAPAQATDVVVLLAEDQATGPWGGLLYAFATGAAPRSWQALSLGPEPHAVGRIADDTLEITPAGGNGFRMLLYRDTHEHPMHVGDRVSTSGLTIEVVDVAEGRPSRIRVHADRSLDDPSFCFASRWRDRLTRIRLPAVGGGVWLR